MGNWLPKRCATASLCRGDFAHVGDLDHQSKNPTHKQDIHHQSNKKRCESQFKNEWSLLVRKSCGFIKFNGEVPEVVGYEAVQILENLTHTNADISCCHMLFSQPPSS